MHCVLFYEFEKNLCWLFGAVEFGFTCMDGETDGRICSWSL